MKGIFIATMVSMLLIGCASTGHPINQDTLSKIKEGETTKQQVEKLIGSPEYESNPGNGECYWSYHFVRVASKVINFVPIARAFAGGSKTETQSVTIIFRPDNIVKNIYESHNASERATGLATR